MVCAPPSRRTHTISSNIVTTEPPAFPSASGTGRRGHFRLRRRSPPWPTCCTITTNSKSPSATTSICCASTPSRHLLADGTPDLQEDYNPDTGAPIVGLPRSHHYNHSTYNDLIHSGLIGIRPHADDVLEVDPLLPPVGSSERPIRYFALENLRYHGHDLTLFYDADGSRYHLGAGLSIFSDGQRLTGPTPLRRTVLRLARRTAVATAQRIDVAVNVWDRAPSQFEADLPIASASSTAEDSHLYEAIDGRVWFFPEIANGWSPKEEAAPDRQSWFAVDLRHAARIDAAEVYLFADGKRYQPPVSYRLQVLSAGVWKEVAGQHRGSTVPIANGVNEIKFPAVDAQQFRLVLTPQPKPARFRLVEFKLIVVPAS